MNSQPFIDVAEKLLETVLQMEQLLDRLLTAHEEHCYALELKKLDKDPF